MGRGVTIALDVEACVGHGRCYALDPVTFAPDDAGCCVVVVVSPVAAEAVARARRAVAACPEGALTIEE